MARSRARPGANHLTRKQWIKKIAERFGDMSKESIGAWIATGDDLTAAKDDLEHGEFMLMIQSELPFSDRTARRFMAISRDPRLTNRSRWLQLPASWGTLYELSRLDDATFMRLLDDGTIRPDMERNEINKLRRIATVAADEERVLNLEPLAGKFRTLVIDPAWEYDWLSLAGRAKPGYAMQTHEELLELDVAAWADDDAGCHLYCWVTNNFMARACQLVAHWGFQHRTIITWIKPPPFGLGSYFRNSTEHVIFATRGDTTTRHAAASMGTHYEWPRGEHSEKPEAFYDLVRAASYPPYGEANQREARPDFVNLFQPENGHGVRFGDADDSSDIAAA